MPYSFLVAMNRIPRARSEQVPQSRYPSFLPRMIFGDRIATSSTRNGNGEGHISLYSERVQSIDTKAGHCIITLLNEPTN